MTQAQGDEHWMQAAIAEARLAGAEGEVPVGAVIVHEGQIIGRGRNKRESSQDPTAHAEMIALREAAERLRSWRVTDSSLYVTLEPCCHRNKKTPPCTDALLAAGVSRVVVAMQEVPYVDSAALEGLVSATETTSGPGSSPSSTPWSGV